MSPNLSESPGRIGRVILGVVVFCALTGLYSKGAAFEEDPPAPNLSQTVIIPNIDDDDGNGLPDFTADVLNGAVDDDLLQIPIKPASVFPGGAVLRVDVAKPWGGFSRIFLLDTSGDVFRPIQSPVNITAQEVAQKGITIGLETTDFADAGRPPALDLNVRLETKDGNPLLQKTIHGTVAPFLVSCCLDPADSVHAVKTKLTERFVTDLEPLVKTAGADLLIFGDAALPEHDIWVQDATEVGYATDGRRLMHVALQGNRGEKLDELFAKRFLGKDSGVIHKGNFRGRSAEWIDWFGNLEVSPPLKARGREFPNGRVYAGTQGARSMHPDVIRFLEAQAAQAPVLWLDTSWLVIGHVDETVSWVPSNIGRPYRMLIPSPRLAVEILTKAEKDAPGCLLNQGTKREGDGPGEFERPVSEVLRDRALMAAQEFVQKKIEGVRRTLQEELGVADADIIEIPVLFRSSFKRLAGRYDAATTNMVNSLLVEKTLIVPDPHGPYVNGRDVLLQAVRDRLEPIGCQVVAVDNFFPYHRWAGEVHCGTNATRRPAGPRS